MAENIVTGSDNNPQVAAQRNRGFIRPVSPLQAAPQSSPFVQLAQEGANLESEEQLLQQEDLASEAEAMFDPTLSPLPEQPAAPTFSEMMETYTPNRQPVPSVHPWLVENQTRLDELGIDVFSDTSGFDLTVPTFTTPTLARPTDGLTRGEDIARLNRRVEQMTNIPRDVLTGQRSQPSVGRRSDGSTYAPARPGQPEPTRNIARNPLPPSLQNNGWFRGLGGQITSLGQIFQRINPLNPVQFARDVQSVTSGQPMRIVTDRTEPVIDFLQSFAPSETENVNIFNGEFGEFGTGIPGALIATMSLPGQLATASVYSTLDLYRALNHDFEYTIPVPEGLNNVLFGGTVPELPNPFALPVQLYRAATEGLSGGGLPGADTSTAPYSDTSFSVQVPFGGRRIDVSDNLAGEIAPTNPYSIPGFRYRQVFNFEDIGATNFQTGGTNYLSTIDPDADIGTQAVQALTGLAIDAALLGWVDDALWGIPQALSRLRPTTTFGRTAVELGQELAGESSTIIARGTPPRPQLPPATMRSAPDRINLPSPPPGSNVPNYALPEGAPSIEELLSRWIPPADGDTSGRAIFRTGELPVEELDRSVPAITARATYPQLTPVTPEEFISSFERGVFVPPPTFESLVRGRPSPSPRTGGGGFTPRQTEAPPPPPRMFEMPAEEFGLGEIRQLELAGFSRQDIISRPDLVQAYRSQGIDGFRQGLESPPASVVDEFAEFADEVPIDDDPFANFESVNPEDVRRLEEQRLAQEATEIEFARAEGERAQSALQEEGARRTQALEQVRQSPDFPVLRQMLSDISQSDRTYGTGKLVDQQLRETWDARGISRAEQDRLLREAQLNRLLVINTIEDPQAVRSLGVQEFAVSEPGGGSGYVISLTDGQRLIAEEQTPFASQPVVQPSGPRQVENVRFMEPPSTTRQGYTPEWEYTLDEANNRVLLTMPDGTQLSYANADEFTRERFDRRNVNDLFFPGNRRIVRERNVRAVQEGNVVEFPRRVGSRRRARPSDFQNPLLVEFGSAYQALNDGFNGVNVTELKKLLNERTGLLPSQVDNVIKRLRMQNDLVYYMDEGVIYLRPEIEGIDFDALRQNIVDDVELSVLGRQQQELGESILNVRQHMDELGDRLQSSPGVSDVIDEISTRVNYSDDLRGLPDVDAIIRSNPEYTAAYLRASEIGTEAVEDYGTENFIVRQLIDQELSLDQLRAAVEPSLERGEFDITLQRLQRSGVVQVDEAGVVRVDASKLDESFGDARQGLSDQGFVLRRTVELSDNGQPLTRQNIVGAVSDVLDENEASLIVRQLVKQGTLSEVGEGLYRVEFRNTSIDPARRVPNVPSSLVPPQVLSYLSRGIFSEEDVARMVSSIEPMRVPAGERPRSYPVQRLNEKTWYHGTRNQVGDLSELNPFIGSSSNELGAGLYLTPSPELATLYARAERSISNPLIEIPQTADGEVFEVTAQLGRVLDGSGEIQSRAFSQAVAQVVRDLFGEDVLKYYEPETYRDAWLELRNAYRKARNGSPISEMTYQRYQVEMGRLLRSMGFDAIYDPQSGNLVVLPRPGERLPIQTANRSALPGGVDPRVARLAVDSTLRESYRGSEIAETLVTQSQLRVEHDLANKLIDEYNTTLERARQLAREQALREVSEEIDEIDASEKFIFEMENRVEVDVAEQMPYDIDDLTDPCI